ncbi:MAG TPA: aminomethyltransferase family protein, partial [Acidimicrobiales bacterium]|nr:aminomethyltransferase family protein [Acidimicrobiales bacterium]
DMTLMGKFLVQGSDAAAVLSRLSANHVARETGRVVYTQWLYPSGGIAADLTVTRLAEDRFLVVTSDLIQRRVEPMIRRATSNEDHCTVTDVTSGTVLLSVQGPLSRQLLSRLSSADLSNETFPYLSARTIDVSFARALALRVTYLGELGYELHVPTEYGAGVYDALMEAGADLGARPVGLAAMAGLRLEKGYRDLGVDIDNTDNPLEAGLGFAVAFDKPGGFIGREALVKMRDNAPFGSLLVSLLVEDPEVDLFGNEPVLLDGRWIGYVRAAAYGHTMGGPVGLAMVAHPEGVTSEWLDSAGCEVWTSRGNRPIVLSAGPLYDPGREKILARGAP